MVGRVGVELCGPVWMVGMMVVHVILTLLCGRWPVRVEMWMAATGGCGGMTG